MKWYAIAYVIGIVYTYFFLARHSGLESKELDSFFCYGTLGVILGGRLGYILFYNLEYYVTHPLETLMVWNGGMSFHGGLIGVLLGIFLFSRRYSRAFFSLSDLCACTASLGICLGRIANFINAELCGRATQHSWGVVFPNSDGIPRHPTQLYEAMSEGLLLFIVMQVLLFGTSIKRSSGMLSGIWITLYGFARIVMENFREPDPQIGYFFSSITMGQILSLPLILSGIMIILLSLKKQKTFHR